MTRALAYFLLDHEIFTIVRASTPHSQDMDMIKYRHKETNTSSPVTSTHPPAPFARPQALREANTDQQDSSKSPTIALKLVDNSYSNRNNNGKFICLLAKGVFLAFKCTTVRYKPESKYKWKRILNPHFFQAHITSGI